MQLICYLLLSGALVFVLALVWLYFRQESLLFFPETLAADHAFALPDVTEERIAVDGATLSAVHYRQPNAKGLVFFLHGNGGNVESWLTDTAFYKRNGYDVFMIDYRGYGKSTGRIDSEAQLHADVLTAWQHVAGEYAGRKNVIYGRSLGSGLAAKLAAALLTAHGADEPGGPHPAASLLVLVSPYLSFKQIARDYYPWVPGFVLRYPIRTDQWLGRLRMPVLMLHGEHDELINVSHARRLKEIKPDAALLILPDAMHNDIHMYPAYIETLEKRLAAL